MIRAGLIGGKLGHSHSAQIHQLIWQELGLRGEYNLLETPAEGLPELLEKIRQDYVGVNVTIPHKIAVLGMCDRVTEAALAIGAVNTLTFGEGRIGGDNTDYFGFGRMLEHFGLSLANRSAAVLGDGGASRCVCAYLDNHKVQYSVLSRKQGFDWSRAAGADLLINATPVGMFPNTGESLVEEKQLAQFQDVLDLIYNPGETLLMQRAKKQGCRVCNGQYMLVAQAVGAEAVWLGRKMPEGLIQRVYDRMRWK